MKRALLIVAVALAGQPFYRDDENAGRRVLDRKGQVALLARAKGAPSPADAVRSYRELLDIDPRQEGETYLGFARALEQTGYPRRARAVARYALRRNDGGNAGPSLRAFLVDGYARERLFSSAVDCMATHALDDPRWAPSYAALTDAEAQAKTGARARALRRVVGEL